MRQRLILVATLFGLTNAPDLFAASQTWTNAPLDNAWNNPDNWVGLAVPGGLNTSGNSDIATFNSPIPGSGLGGAGSPIINDPTRGIRSLLFDTADCGAYVFGSSLADNHLEITHLGNITVNAAVTNPVTFRQGLRFRLPSSTNGRYDLTNNAASANASLYIEAIVNTSANTRPMVMFLGGSNTGTNTIARFEEEVAASGAILLDKVGTGTWILSGPNNFPQKTSAGNVARVAVREGTLIVKDPDSLGAISAANLFVTNTGVLQIDGVSLNNTGIGLRLGGTIRMNGTGTVNGITVGNQAATTATLSTTSSGDVLTVAGTGGFTGGAADTVLHTAGPGTIQLNIASTYVGRWSLDSGTNQLLDPSGLGTGANTHIAAGALLDVSPLGATYTLGTTALSASGTGTAVGTTAAAIDAGAVGTFDLGSRAVSLTFSPTTFTGDTTHPALYISRGTLQLGGNPFTVNNASGSPLGAGTYRLIQQATGSITSSGGYAVTVTGSGLVPFGLPTIQVVNGELNMVIVIYVPKDLVWTGGNPNSTWDNGITANWLNLVLPSVFNPSDKVIFNSIGSTNPTVTLSGTLSPGSVTVDTAANDYTFSGAGQIAGATSLTKVSSGTLVIQTANTYGGGTVVSNGTVRLGVDNALPSTGAGDVALYSPGVIDLNNFSDTINGLSGNGTVDNQGGGASILTIGNNNNSGTFSGVIQNTSGTLGLTKAGNGTETLTAANTYTGPTTISAGTLRVDNYNALGSGNSALTINAGTLQVSTNVLISSLAGAGGGIANAPGSATNRLIIQGAGAYDGLISDGASGRVGILVNAGTLRLNAANTFSGGTILASGAGLAYGNVGQTGPGGVIASNETTISMPAGNAPSAGVAANITTVDGATVTFTSATTANSWNGQFIGGATATNIFFGGNMSIGGSLSFSNFLGTVIFSNGNVRLFNAISGGDNTTFHIATGTGLQTRDATVVRLGALTGLGGIFPATVTPPSTYWIGGKGVDSTFSGNFGGANNLVKVGAGRLTFDGGGFVEATDNATYTNRLYDNSLITYSGTTTISNGVLALVVPNNLDFTPLITLATASAVLDASRMGYISNLLDINLSPTNSFLVTNGVIELLAGQTLAGLGTIAGSLLADNGSIINVGLPLGTLTITNQATLNGAINLDLNRTNTPANSDRMAANSFAIDPGATLNVVNIGPALLGGEVFQLFNKPVNLASVTLPPIDSPLSWTNKLAIDGTIAVLGSLVNISPTNITFSVTGSAFTLSWPTDYTGWRLQAQTNSLSVGISTNWVNVVGSEATNSVIMTIDPANGSVFYRLVLP